MGQKKEREVFEMWNSEKGQVRIMHISSPEKVVVLVSNIKWWEATQQVLLLN